jgi:Tfp pilus assembly protein PilX
MLIAMTLAGLAMYRQVGTGVVIARNLTFRQGATTSSDRGVEAARTWLTAQTSGTLEQASVANGYYPGWCNNSVSGANIPDANNDGIVDDCAATPTPSTFSPTGYNWANSIEAVADDGAGNRVRYVIHRMCRIPGSLNAPNQQCVTVGAASSGGSKGAATYGTQALSNTIQPYFRITTRVDGPMNTVVYTQSIVY